VMTISIGKIGRENPFCTQLAASERVNLVPDQSVRGSLISG
jgi:hypothetical protein